MTRADDIPLTSPSPLVAAGRLLAERGVYGLVWFDENLRVSARYGRLAEFVEVDEPLLDACLPLFGFDEEIRALRQAPGRVLDLPAIMMVTAAEAMPRVNLTVFWHQEGRHYVMLIARATSRSDADNELSKQMRARLIAEVEVAQKSRELARANVELERANRDLEDFAAIISHDLKSPLRALRYTAEDMTRLLDEGDIAAARERLEEIGQRTRRMSDMMSSLLDYASVGRKSEIADLVETRTIAETVTRSLRPPAGFAITITGTWPAIHTVAAALDLVLRNLVQNALMHHDRETGAIVINASEVRNSLLIRVIDDGPGIDPAHHKTILLPFRKLSTKAGSTGMGLAFVNRTVETMGGELSIKSDPAKARGTTFCLMWPLKSRE